jgi:arylsulfatase A-like enzyme
VLNIDGKKIEAKGYTTDLLTDYTIDWLDKRKHDKPFFVYLSHKAGHMMVEPAARHAGKYADAPIEYPASIADTEENYKGKPQWVKRQRNSWHGVDGMYNKQMSFDTFYRKYCETLFGLDENIGRVLDYLDKSGLAENTVVFYMSDNGFLLGEHGLIDKRAMYEESMRVPLLAYCPGLIKAGSKIEQMVQNIDIAPTILDIAGVKAPNDMDGKSFLPLLTGNDIPWRDSVFYEYFWERHYPQTPTMHGIRTDRYKYIHYYGIWDTDELYDLQNDPNEMNNLIKSPEHQTLVKELNSRMYKWLENTNGMAIPLTRDIEFRAG